MPQTRSKYEFYKESSLSQQLAHKHPEFSDYAGSDKEISLALAMFNILDRHGKIDLKEEGWKLIKDLLNEQRKAIFATSDHVNEITKMGLQMPKSEDEFYGTGDIDENTDT